MPMSLTMTRKALLAAAACALVSPLAALADEHPAYIPKTDVQGAIFKRPETKKVKDGDGTALDITTFASESFGGDQQVGAAIVEVQIDFVFFFSDPLEQHPHDMDVKALSALR